MLQMYDFLIDILYFCINLFITDTKKPYGIRKQV